MKIFATSDTHFGHEKLTQWGRPVDFGERLLASIAMNHGDLLIHCGDFCIGNDEENIKVFMDKAKTFKRKILVRGNHDGKPDGWYMERGFDFVCNTFTAKYFGKRYIFSHAPLDKTPAFDRNIHGHLHGNSHRAAEFEGKVYDHEWHYDLAPELHDYKIISLERLK